MRHRRPPCRRLNDSPWFDLISINVPWQGFAVRKNSISSATRSLGRCSRSWLPEGVESKFNLYLWIVSGRNGFQGNRSVPWTSLSLSVFVRAKTMRSLAFALVNHRIPQPGETWRASGQFRRPGNNMAGFAPRVPRIRLLTPWVTVLDGPGQVWAMVTHWISHAPEPTFNLPLSIVWPMKPWLRLRKLIIFKIECELGSSGLLSNRRGKISKFVRFFRLRSFYIFHWKLYQSLYYSWSRCNLNF